MPNKMNLNVILVTLFIFSVTLADNRGLSAPKAEWGPPLHQWKPSEPEWNPERERCESKLGKKIQIPGPSTLAIQAVINIDQEAFDIIPILSTVLPVVYPENRSALFIFEVVLK